MRARAVGFRREEEGPLGKGVGQILSGVGFI